MMASVDVYWANPGSSIGFVVSHWRGSKPTLPERCYTIPEGVAAKYPGYTWVWDEQDVLLKGYH